MAASGRATRLVTGAASPRRCACRAVGGACLMDTPIAGPLQRAGLIHVAGSHFFRKKKKISARDDNVNFKIKVNACEFSMDL